LPRQATVPPFAMVSASKPKWLSPGLESSVNVTAAGMDAEPNATALPKAMLRVGAKWAKVRPLPADCGSRIEPVVPRFWPAAQTPFACRSPAKSLTAPEMSMRPPPPWHATLTPAPPLAEMRPVPRSVPETIQIDPPEAAPFQAGGASAERRPWIVTVPPTAIFSAPPPDVSPPPLPRAVGAAAVP